MIPIVLASIGIGAILSWFAITISSARHRRRKIPSLTKYVVFSLSMVILYTITAITYQCIFEQELSSTLTTCFMACFGGEILSAALVKIYKLKEEDKNDDFDCGEHRPDSDDMGGSDSNFQGG